MDEIKGFFRQAGKEFLNAAGDAAMGAAKDVMGSVINEIFIKKEAETKRILPSIKNMKVVSYNKIPLSFISYIHILIFNLIH